MQAFPQFGSNAGASGANATDNALVSFKAGKMSAVEQPNGKFLVTPELQKGKISLIRGQDQLIHFQWTNRDSKTVENDYIIFPEDAAFQKVNTGKDTDRVYVLQYKNSNRRFFFWLQDMNKANDDSNATKLTEFMNNPPQPNEPTGTAGATGQGGQLDQNALMQMLGALNQSGGGGGASGAPSGAANPAQMNELQNILQNLGYPGAPPTANTAATPSSTGGGGESATDSAPAAANSESTDEMTEEELLQRAIEESMKDSNSGNANNDNGDNSTSGNSSNETTAVTTATTTTTAATTPATSTTNAVTMNDMQNALAFLQQSQGSKVKLSKLLTADNVASILDDDECRAELIPQLPETMQNVSELMQTMRAPQLQHGIATLSHALQSGDPMSLMSNFGLNPSAGIDKLNRGDAIGAFLDALEDYGKK